jgi:hypothetical protein
MAITEAYTGTATVSTTEFSLTNNSTVLQALNDLGAFQLSLDTSAMTATEQYELRIYKKVVSTGSQRRAETQAFLGVQVEPAYVSPTIVLRYGWEMTLKKLVGTDRSFSWSIDKVA